MKSSCAGERIGLRWNAPQGGPRDGRDRLHLADRERYMSDSVEDGSNGRELRSENERRSDPEQGRDDAADGCVVPKLEIVTDGSQVVRLGDASHRRPDPQRERN